MDIDNLRIGAELGYPIQLEAGTLGELIAEIDRLRTELGQHHAQRDRAAAERRASGVGR